MAPKLMISILKAESYVAEQEGDSNIKLTKTLKNKFNKNLYEHHVEKNEYV